jgi:glycosyltransferase involved in cell wall biosynthesis
MTKPADFSIVVPCFNERDAIEPTLRELVALDFSGSTFEVIVVDDGSNDGTSDILTQLAESMDLLRVFRHPGNRGYGASLKTGIRRARYDHVVITDADGTYPNHMIPNLCRKVEEADMVVGSRTGVNVQYSKLRRIPKIFLRRYVSWIVRQNVPDFNSGLRVFRKDLAEKFFHILPDGFSFTTTITIAMLLDRRDVLFVPIDYSRRTGKSKIKPIRDTLRFVQLIARTGIYFAPLRVLFPVVLLLSFFLMISLVYDIFFVQNLTDKSVMLFLAVTNTTIFALLADMIEKRLLR